jgi:adenosine deaminase
VLLESGATVALGADDPLLFGSQLAAQYATMRAAHDLSDETLADLAAMSIRASCAPDELKATLLDEVAVWLTGAPASATMTP